jgi:NAD(P)-dependent dehydrogenase (short-subunit alcohol dehydrogenase family)
VIVNGRSPDSVSGALSSLEAAAAGRVAGLAVDMGSAEAIDALVERFPEVDVLVNNVGIFEPKPFEEIPDADWLRIFEVNVLAGVRLARAYLPRMRRRDWGRIIFVSSESAIQIPAEMIHYGVTKSAQVAVARGLAEAVAGTGITVNSVLPGPTRSRSMREMVESRASAEGKSFREIESEFFEPRVRHRSSSASSSPRRSPPSSPISRARWPTRSPAPR